jgi:hypothetical protein
MAGARDLGTKNRNQKKKKAPPMKPQGSKKPASATFLKGTKPKSVRP